MAITTTGKIHEMIKDGHADYSVEMRHDKVSREHRDLKERFELSKEEHKEAQESLREAQERLEQTPMLQRKNIRKRVRILEKREQSKKAKYESARRLYKAKLKELRALKKQIRMQYRNCKEFEKFFKKVNEAKKMGIIIPRYIKEEYKNQMAVYQRSIYAVSKGGNSEIPEFNKAYIKDIESLISKHRMMVVKQGAEQALTTVQQGLNNAITTVRNAIDKDDER